MRKMKKFMIDESGQGMVEYALILAFIAMAVVLSVEIFGGGLLDSFNDSNSKINGGSGE